MMNTLEDFDQPFEYISDIAVRLRKVANVSQR